MGFNFRTKPTSQVYRSMSVSRGSGHVLLSFFEYGPWTEQCSIPVRQRQSRLPHRGNKENEDSGASDQCRDRGLGADRTLDGPASVIREGDPVLIEAVQHPDAGIRVFHALRTKLLLPSLAWHRHGAH